MRSLEDLKHRRIQLDDSKQGTNNLCFQNIMDEDAFGVAYTQIMSSLEDLEHIKIPLNDIKQATNNFAYENIIDKGAFGVVYKGELSWQLLAFKRLTNAVGLQRSEFYNEVIFRSTIYHQNIISLVGFCDEDDEMILVLEHQSYGRLDMYLSSPRLTWRMRVDICIYIAWGLAYLHSQMIILGDLKSGSIHLDERWPPKIGLSKSFVMNEQLSSFNNFSNLGYVDPLYMETGRVTKETDIYSFGVILFELLCGRQATTKDEETGWFLSRLACHHYENGTLTEIIDPVLRRQMNQESLNVISRLAYRCLNMDPFIRPTASTVRNILVNTFYSLSGGGIRREEVRDAQLNNKFSRTNRLGLLLELGEWFGIGSSIASDNENPRFSS
ncbi:receptor-like protein kinase HERK 1 [Tanacetum coccineum]